MSDTIKQFLAEMGTVGEDGQTAWDRLAADVHPDLVNAIAEFLAELVN